MRQGKSRRSASNRSVKLGASIQHKIMAVARTHVAIILTLLYDALYGARLIAGTETGVVSEFRVTFADPTVPVAS